MIVAINPRILRIPPLVLAMYGGKPSFLKKVFERYVGRENDFDLVKEDYDGIKVWPLIQKFRAYRVYRAKKKEEVGYSFGFSFIDEENRKAFYMQRLKTRDSGNGMILNFKTLEEKAVKDIFAEGHEYILGFVKSKLIKMVKRRTGYREKELKGLVGFLTRVGSKIRGGRYMVRTPK